MLIHYLVVDEPDIARWQSGLFALTGARKPAYGAFLVPFAQASRSHLRTTLWGQIRPRTGRQTYRLQQFRSGAWRTVTVARTDSRGFFTRTVRADKGAQFRVWSPRDKRYSPVVTLR
jgi:hypothetical protein